MKRFLPPHLFVVCAIGAAGLGLLRPVLGPMLLPLRLSGLVVGVFGLLLTVRSAAIFDSAQTNIKTFDTPDVLIASGPFRFSRNPMYLGFALALLGLAVGLGSLSAFVAPAIFWACADRWYIPFEERRMADTFGEAYDRYLAAVPRWVGFGRK